MADTKERLATAQWVFERNVGWVAAAEIKVGVVVAINTAMVGGLAAAFAAPGTHSSWSFVMTAFASFCSVCSMLCAVAAVFPRLTGPDSSLLFFGKIASVTSAEYSHRFIQATDQEILADWTEQIHRNAEIASLKHAWVKKSMAWSFVGVLPWVAAIFLLLKI